MMRSMMDLLKAIYPLRLAPVSPDTDRCGEILQEELPFDVHKYACESEHNGWVVPQNWYVKKAVIRKDGRVVYDGMEHPLGVIGYSRSFHGKIGVAELKPHLFTHHHWPEGLVYHCDLFYKVGKKDWGFCVPRTLLDSLPEGEYEVDLETAHEAGEMKVHDYLLAGESTDTIVLNAHNCHAGQANDDVSGMVVGIEVMRRLAARPRRYSYRLIIAPEHFGTIFYLAGAPEEVVQTFRACIFMEMLGNIHRLALQETFTGKSLLDRAAHNFLQHHKPGSFTDKFRKIIGNDETVWEGAGYDIPTISLSRFPYPEYHSSMDTADIIIPEKLEESVDTILNILQMVENESVVTRKFRGLVALSNPRYNLYIDQADPSLRPAIGEEQRRWNYLMDCIPRYFDGATSIMDIAEKHQLCARKIHEYVGRFQEKGLVDISPIAYS